VTGTSVTDHEVEIKLPGVGRRTFLMNARILHEGQSASRKILIAIVDVTDARREGHALEAAKSEAERANAGKSRFLAAASHDLRQPLQTISLLQGLLERHAQDEPARKLLHRLDETVTTMSSMLDKLLDINQLEAGVVQPAVRDFPVSQLLDEMRTDYSPTAKSNGLELRVVPSSLLVRSDPRLLEQIVRNLLSNAMKYTAKGRVLLGCRRHGDKVTIEVWDTGAGIPQAELGAIFDEFHQLNNPARQRSKGLGLGLAIVQRLADLLGHKINVRSRVDVGSMFSTEVPFATLSEPVPQPSTHDQPLPFRTRASSILIVDDDPSVREMLQMLLEAEGHLAIVAADGPIGLDLAAREARELDLIVADYNLPAGPNGLELIAELRTRFERDIPAIVLTGDISTSSLKAIARSGCVHLNKPVKAADLIRVVERLLAKSQPRASGSAAIHHFPVEETSSTIFVVDDDAVLRETMCELLRHRGFAAKPFADGAAFLNAYQPGQRGCLLVDAIMPGMSGIEVVERLKRDGRDLPAIVITGNGAISMAVQAMKAGAVDFIEKPVRHDELLAAIAGAIEGSQHLGSAGTSQTAAVARMSSLTSRQRQILDLVLAGHPSKNIAVDLGISQRTVDNHRAAIMRKTGSKSMPALVRTALAAA
jgi:two-component system, chemotaxis family, CheB/CheR fusion protein